VKPLFLAAALAAAAAALPAHAQEPSAAPEASIRLELNLPENRLRVFEGDSLLKSYRVSVGMPGHDTPDGEYQIATAEWNPWWRPPPREWARDDKPTPPGPSNPMGRVKLFFAPLYYIHGTPDAENIGAPASHGCVRMLNRDVVELARLLHDRAGGSIGQAEIARVLSRPGQTRASRLAAPVPLSIHYRPVVIQGGELVVFPDIYERGWVHTEAVIQALQGAGYDAASVDRATIRQVLARAKERNSVFRVKLTDAFSALRPLSGTQATELR
jgi:L,D-transpeptidase ErfK/SrfK